MHIEEKIFNLVKKIPRGKVTTYKEIAKKLKIHPRVVGLILSRSRGSIPCYRIIMSNGKIGGYSLGKGKKIELLRKDGIEIKKGKVNLKKYLHRF